MAASPVFGRKLKVSKTDGYRLDVSKWLGSESLSSFTVTQTGGKVTVGATSNDGGKLYVLLTGVAEGVADVEWRFQTATRSDCYASKVVVVANC